MDNQVTLVFAYLLVSCYFLRDCLKLFLQKDKLSPEEMFLSLVIALIVTISWPVVVPISSIQALRNKELEMNNVMPAILAIFVVSLLTVSGLAAFAEALL
jgi:hypothetical protein